MKTPDNVFGLQLKRVRTDMLGMSQTQLAAAIGVSAQSVRAWEQGVSLPVGEPVWRLFHLLGPDVFGDLMPHVAPQPATVPVDGDAQATLVTLKGSKPDRLAELVRLAERIARE